MSLTLIFAHIAKLHEDPPKYLAHSLEDFLKEGAVEALQGVMDKYKIQIDELEAKSKRMLGGPAAQCEVIGTD